MTSTRYYDSHADALFARYATTNAEELHADWATHLRQEPGFACDIGAGSHRDPNWLAAKGWEVVAVEPSALRDLAAPESHPRVVWMNDALPDLRALRALGRRFDLILLSAVWMHVAPQKRERAFRILSELLSPSGLLVISLRKSGDAEEAATTEDFSVVRSEGQRKVRRKVKHYNLDAILSIGYRVNCAKVQCPIRASIRSLFIVNPPGKDGETSALSHQEETQVAQVLGGRSTPTALSAAKLKESGALGVPGIQ